MNRARCDKHPISFLIPKYTPTSTISDQFLLARMLPLIYMYMFTRVTNRTQCFQDFGTYKFKIKRTFCDHFTVDLLLMILINFTSQYYCILCLSSVSQLFQVHMRF